MLHKTLYRNRGICWYSKHIVRNLWYIFLSFKYIYIKCMKITQRHVSFITFTSYRFPTPSTSVRITTGSDHSSWKVSIIAIDCKTSPLRVLPVITRFLAVHNSTIWQFWSSCTGYCFNKNYSWNPWNSWKMTYMSHSDLGGGEQL